MGHSDSKEEKRDEFVDQLSESDLKNLHKVFVANESEEGLSLEACNRNLKLHLSKNFPSELSDAIAAVLFDWQDKSTSQDSTIEKKLVAKIARLTHGTKEYLLKFICQTINNKEEGVSPEKLKAFMTSLFECFSTHPSAILFGATPHSYNRIMKSLNPQNKEKMEEADLGDGFENIPNLVEICQFAFKIVFYNAHVVADKDMYGFMPILVPNLELPPKMNLGSDNTILGFPDVMRLNCYLPLQYQHKWRFLYSSSIQGESFSKFSTQIIDKGALLLIVRDQEGHIFGGFISTNVMFSSQFQGDDRSFLFTVEPTLGVFTSTGYNDHFVYLNMGQETIPNGLGMGGQHDYFGLWLSTEFGKGHSKAKPTSTTYGSPQLSFNDEFRIDLVEAWAVGDEPQQDEEEGEHGSVIDKHPDMVAMLRIAGKEPVSEGYRESEVTSTQPAVSNLHIPHDPMDYP